MAFETTESQDHEFRIHLARGEILLQKCRACSTMRFPARWVCSECLSEDYDWQPVAGTGIVECFVWYMEPFDARFAKVPYNVALVKLSEGPRMITNVVEVEFGALHVGQNVQASIRRRDNGRFALDFRVVS